jgi:hypothetical protein
MGAAPLSTMAAQRDSTYEKGFRPISITGQPLTRDEAQPVAVSFAKLPDLLAALPRLIVNNMARGVYLIGSKLAQRASAAQIVDCAGNCTTLRLKDYISRKIKPEYKTLPWQQDVAVLLSANEKPKK